MPPTQEVQTSRVQFSVFSQTEHTLVTRTQCGDSQSLQSPPPRPAPEPGAATGPTPGRAQREDLAHRVGRPTRVGRSSARQPRRADWWGRLGHPSGWRAVTVRGNWSNIPHPGGEGRGFGLRILMRVSCLYYVGWWLRSAQSRRGVTHPFLPQNLLSDERLSQSEALYAFLSPSPDYLKVIDVQGKKPTFSLSSFLERLPRDFFPHQEVSCLEPGPRVGVCKPLSVRGQLAVTCLWEAAAHGARQGHPRFQSLPLLCLRHPPVPPPRHSAAVRFRNEGVHDGR